jgi:hypothetical protein
MQLNQRCKLKQATQSAPMHDMMHQGLMWGESSSEGATTNRNKPRFCMQLYHATRSSPRQQHPL